jgi:hypothetical protein
MLEHAEPILDRVAAPERALGVREHRLARRFGWVLNEALLFPIAALYLVTLTAALPRELLSDSWYAIFGGHFVAHHGLPSHDALTIWEHGRAWVDQQWLGQLYFYGLYAAGGTKLALLGHVAASGTAFVLAIVFARRLGASVRSVCWIALPSIFLLIWSSWNARAQSLAVLLFVIVVWLLIRDARSPSRRVYLTFPLLILWANIHGTVVTGALLVVLLGVTYAIERRREPLRQWAPRAALLCFAPIACVFASPYATSLPGYYQRMFGNSGFRDHVTEWRPTAPDFQTAPFYLLAFLTVWLIGRRSDQLTWFEKLLLVVMLLLGLQTLRGVLWFTLAALMLTPALLDAVLKPNTSAMRFGLLNRALVATSVAGIAMTLLAVALKPSSWFERGYPQAALAAVQRVEARSPHVRVFANEQYADWLLLRRPELSGRIALDVRFELLTRDQLDNLVAIRRQVDGWKRAVAPYGLFFLKKGVDDDLAKGLLRQRGMRLEYRGRGLIVISRTSGRLA